MVKAILLVIFLVACGEFSRMNESNLKIGEKSLSELKIKDGKMFDSSGQQIQLRGISSHGLAWYPNYYHKQSIKYLKENMKINVFRAAMYTEEWGGYINNRSIADKVNEIVQAAIDLDIYVIIDWHILKDGNPLTHKMESKEFFDSMSKKWANVPNVIYEICNEPNGWPNWRNSIKEYAEYIIPTIRKNSPNAIIIVGTGNWSQDIQDPANDPLKFDNVAYALHFYSGTHGQWLRDRINYAMSKKVAVFVSEWGVSQSSGGGGVYRDESKRWLDFLDQNKISWVNWSLAPKDESSAMLKVSAKPSGNWSNDDLSESGKFVRDWLTSH